MPPADGTHSTRRNKVSSIYRCTKNLHAVQLRLRHTKHQPETNDMHRSAFTPDNAAMLLIDRQVGSTDSAIG